MTPRASLVLAWTAFLGLLAYWSLYVLVAPVTTTDAQIYNLGRLLIAERGGLFNNPLWTEFHQIYFPWAFDAVHYGLVKLGRAENLPSFLCLLGVLAVAASHLTRNGATGAIPLVGLALLASPMIAFQATATKNDLPLLFLLVAGLFFLRRWMDEPTRLAPPLAVAFCAAFAVGTKTSGLLVAAILVGGAILAAWQTRNRSALAFGLGAPVLLVLVGSVETAWHNARRFGDWRGEPSFVAWHQHTDGLAGAIANAIRYVVNGAATGLESERFVRPYRGALSAWCEAVLTPLGLRDVGFGGLTPPEDFLFLIGNAETASTFGVVGFGAPILALVLLLRLPPQRLEWWLAGAGWLYFAGVCLTVAWMPFNLRFLVPAYGAWLVALGLAAGPWLLRRPVALAAGVVILGALAVAVPLLAWNRSPSAIALSLVDRNRQMLRERVELADELRLVSRAEKHAMDAPRVVVLGPNGWVLPFLQRPRPWLLWPNLHAAPTLTTTALATLPGWPADAREAIVLVSQQPDVEVTGDVEVLATTPAGSRLLRVRLGDR